MDSLVVSASQDAGGYAIPRQNNLELHLVLELFYIGMPVGLRLRGAPLLNKSCIRTAEMKSNEE